MLSKGVRPVLSLALSQQISWSCHIKELTGQERTHKVTDEIAGKTVRNPGFLRPDDRVNSNRVAQTVAFVK